MAAPKSTSVMGWLETKVVYSVGFGVVLMLAIGAGLFYFYAKAPARVVRIAYGSGGPVRTHFLEQMARHGKTHDLDIRLIVTDGADQTMSLVDQGAADLGLVTGAIDDNASRDVYEIAPLYMEPLQLLVREPLYDAVSKDFAQLQGKSIAIDGLNTATNVLATELLAFMGLSDPATGQPHYRPVLTPRAQYPEIKDADLPDAIFQIGGLPSPAIRNMIVNRDYRLVALPFGESFNLEKFQSAQPPDLLKNSRLRLNRAFVEEAMIPEFTYSVLPPVPPIDTQTVATRLILLGGKNLTDVVIHRILELLISPEISMLTKPALSVDVLRSSYQFPRHPGTDRYLDSLEPINVEGAFDAYGRVVEVWGVIITLYIGSARYWKKRRQKQARLEMGTVGDFMKQVIEVETEMHASRSQPERIILDRRLSEIKKHVIELHLDERLEDSENLHSLLTTIADARTKIWGSSS